MASAFDPHPWFRPLWRRVLVTALCAGWVVFELAYSGDGFWTIIAGACAGYCLWSFFLSGDYRVGADDTTKD